MYPEKIYATDLVGSNGIKCLDYRNDEEDVEYIRADTISLKLEKLVMLQNTVKRFLEFEKGFHLTDECANDGDGYFDTWQSSQLETLLEKLKEHSNFKEITDEK